MKSKIDTTIKGNTGSGEGAERGEIGDAFWVPELQREGPVYRELVRALDDDIRSGELRPGDRLPTHRQLSSSLGVARGTVARAYDEAARLGLIESGIGQGTFVAHSYEVQARRRGKTSDAIELGMGFPIHELDPDPGPVLATLAREPGRSELLGYPPPEGSPEHREAGASWCRSLGLETHADEVVVTVGGQNAIHLWLSTTLEPGDVLLTAEHTYRMAVTAARGLGIEVRGVAMDGEGVLPDALETAARMKKARGLYLMPTFQNPTAAVLSPARRLEIVEVARRRDLAVLEDDIHGAFLATPLPPLRSLAPERVTYVVSLSKTVAGGLRIAFAVPPSTDRPALLTSLVTSLWSPPPLAAEIARRWIDDGTARRVVAAKIVEADRRIRHLRELLEPRARSLSTGAYFAWLGLPEPWTANRFALAARQAGVSVMPADAFWVGEGAATEAVRLALGAVDAEAAAEGCRRLAEILDQGTQGLSTPLL